MSYNTISKQFFVPYSTVRRILIENSREDWKSDRKWIGIKNSNEYSDIIENYIQKFYNTISSTFVAEDIKKKIKHDLGISLDLSDIRSILKNKLNLRFKKWSSRPINIDQLRFSLIRALYAIEFTNIWEEDALIINIDEVLFSNKTKQEYL